MSETDYRRVDLPLAEVEALARDLAVGGGLLSAEILRQWSVRAIWTGAGPGVSPQDLTNINRGRLQTPLRLNPLVVSFMARFLAAGPDSLAFFEDAVARSGDAALARARSPYVVIADQVFPFLAGAAQDEAMVTNLLLDAWSWRLTGVLTRSSEPPGGHHITDSLNDLVARAEHVIMGAWDGEGVLVIDRL